MNEACPACGKFTEIWATLKDRMHGIAGTYQARRCPTCGTIFLAPQPSNRDLADHYPERYTVWQATAAGTPLGRDYRTRARALLSRGGLVGAIGSRALSRLAGIESFELARAHSSPGRLLDVGSGGGEVLDSFARLSWSTTGIEPGEAAAQRSRERGHSIIEGDFASVELESQFDLVVFSHSLEHMRDPRASLEKARTLLAPGGSIFVATPNASGVLARLAGKNWWQLDAPRHLVVLSKRGLQSAANRAGLRVSELHTHSIPMGPLVSHRLAHEGGFLIEQWRGTDDPTPIRAAARAVSIVADLVGVGDNLHATLRAEP